jgi:SAM-dependent methyltransferase
VLPVQGLRVRLVLRSAALLFVELWLIRWTGSYVVYLAYFTNFLLLASFLGIGIGFLRASRPRDLSRWAPLALAVYVGLVLLFPVEVHREGHGLVYSGNLGVPPQWVILPLLFAGATVVMALMGESVARAFGRFQPLQAYLLDLTGSLVGVLLYAGLALVQASPLAAAVVATALFLGGTEATRREWIVRAAGAAALIGTLAVAAVGAHDIWSPYYRISVDPVPGAGGQTAVSVNGVPHQTIKSVGALAAQNPIYFAPYGHLGGRIPRRVLIIGAGTGNDVAVALSKGVSGVDAVEIDPRLPDIGRDRHPDAPFSDPRVRVYVTDGRAFLDRTRSSYDLILFALPDSLTLVSGQASLRLESYLFTVEALREARDRLAPGGVFAMYNYYRRPWLIDRLAVTERDAFGSVPCLDVLPGPRHPAVLSVGLAAGSERCSTPWRAATSPLPAPSTDDHPFPYLRTPSVPAIYLWTLLLVLLASVGAVSTVAGGLRPLAGYLDLFFMGAAFLLLETKNVVQFALLFGTTWIVNALVFAGILLTLLAAVLVAQRVRIRRPGLPYVALFLALGAAWLVPPSALLSLPLVPRFVAATALAFTPVFLANLVFSERFAGVSASTAAFAANLLGAMVGGLIEYLALATGYRMLLVVAALLYALAWAFRPRAEVDEVVGETDVLELTKPA